MVADPNAVSPHEESDRSRRDLFVHPLWLVLILAVVWVATWRNLGEPSLRTSDEAAHTDVARNVLQRGHWLDLWFYEDPYWGKPPLKIWATAVLLSTFGQEESVVRFPDALLASLTVLLVWLLARRHLGGPATVAAPLILVTAPYPLLLHGFREGVQDTALVFCLAVAAACFLEYDRDPARRGWIVGMGLSVAAATMVKTVVAFLILPPVFLWVLIHRRRDLPFLSVVTGLSLAPWLLWHQRMLKYELMWNFTKRFSGWKGEGHPPSVYVEWLVGGIAPWSWLLPIGLATVVWAAVRGSRFDRFTILWAGALLGPWPFAEVKHPWYLYPAYPVLALVVARTIFPPELWSSPKRSPVRRGLMAVGLVGFVLAAGHAVRDAWRFGDMFELEPIHAVSDWVKSVPASDRVLGIGLDPRGVCPDERYYFDLTGASHAYVPQLAAVADLAVHEPRAVVVLPIPDLPRFMALVAPYRDLSSGTWAASFVPRCRRSREVGRLPFRIALAIGFADRPPAPFEPFEPIHFWDGFGLVEEGPKGRFAWLSEEARLWIPFAGCATVRFAARSFHQENRLEVSGPGVSETWSIGVRDRPVEFQVDVGVGGAMLDLQALDGCLVPRDVDPTKQDSRCLGMSVSSLEIRTE